MTCTDCDGNDPDCLRCDGTGELCDICGEAPGACLCGVLDSNDDEPIEDEDQDDDDE